MKKPNLWYHGGPRIEDWSDVRWDRRRGQSDLNAEGPGIYWTSDREEAETYGPVVYEAEMRDGFGLFPITRKAAHAKLRALYDLAPAPRQQNFLSTWPKESVMGALKHYSNQTSLFDAYVTLYHDLFQYNAEEYVAALRSLGYDGYIYPRGTTGGSRRRDHLILWNPRAMRIR